MITKAMGELAVRIGPSRAAEELLPQCWEQVSMTSSQELLLPAMSHHSFQSEKPY